MENNHFLGSLFLLFWNISLKSKKELNDSQFYVHKLTGQSLKSGKLMTDEVGNTFGHVRRPSVVSTPDFYLKFVYFHSTLSANKGIFMDSSN